MLFPNQKRSEIQSKETYRERHTELITISACVWVCVRLFFLHIFLFFSFERCSFIYSMSILRKNVDGHTVHDDKTHDFFFTYSWVNATACAPISTTTQKWCHTTKIVLHIHDFKRIFLGEKKNQLQQNHTMIKLQIWSHTHSECILSSMLIDFLFV